MVRPSQSGGTFCLPPPPAIADVALERLCKERLKRPKTGSHIFVVPRLMTSRWRKQLNKAATFSFEIPVGCSLWGAAQHEPLIIAVFLPLSKHSPWNLRNTRLVGDLESSLRAMQQFDGERTGSVLRKFLRVTDGMEALPGPMVREIFHPTEASPLPYKGTTAKGVNASNSAP